MQLRGQEKGYAMAALLVAMSVMAVMMTVAMPVWKQMVQREKEEELVFRGLQYARAVGLFQRKYANATPPNLDVLVEQKFLRRKYKDPMTLEDFQPLLAGQAVTLAAPPAGRGGAAPTVGGGRGSSQPGQTVGAPAAAGSAAGTTGGIVGVASKSRATSIRLDNGRTRYNEWAFVYTPLAQTPGAGGEPGTAMPGQRGQEGQAGQGGRGGEPGGRGRGEPPPNGPGRQSGPGRPFGQGPGSGVGNLGGFSPQPTAPAPRGR